ncbi:hypothetical protein [Streptomyces axinellae]|uniref:hypothetical protein n=1 Tax=Streptomyces axinellae TaxID=552788 RepID=UPI0031CE7A06
MALAPPQERRRLQLTGLDDDVLADLDDQRPHLLVPGEVDEARQARLDAALEGRRTVIGATIRLGGAADSLRWARRTLSLVETGVIQEARTTRCEEHKDVILVCARAIHRDSSSAAEYTELPCSRRDGEPPRHGPAAPTHPPRQLT